MFWHHLFTSSQSAPPGKTSAFNPEPSTDPCVMGRMTLDGPLLIPSSLRDSFERYARMVKANSSFGAIPIVEANVLGCESDLKRMYRIGLRVYEEN
jgi:hypothetical protein